MVYWELLSNMSVVMCVVLGERMLSKIFNCLILLQNFGPMVLNENKGGTR